MRVTRIDQLTFILFGCGIVFLTLPILIPKGLLATILFNLGVVLILAAVFVGPIIVAWSQKKKEVSQDLEIEKELKKAIAISIARKLEAKGDWWALWLGRQEAYEEILALIQGDMTSYACHTIVTSSNLELAKEKGFWKEESNVE